jgi:prepilin-type N-terminal cleavage/methylation domain-containing protein
LVHKRIFLHSGFTLLELLTVVAVIALLAALLFPVLAQAREKARQTTCLARVQQIGRAQVLYALDWDERLPHGYFQAAPRPQPYGEYTFWTEFFQPYLRNHTILPDHNPRWIIEDPTVARLAEYVLLTWGRGGYGTVDDPFWQWAGEGFLLSTVSRPSETLSLADGFTTSSWTAIDKGRHHGGFIAGFVDGHAKWMTQDQFYRVDRNNAGEYYFHFASADRG